MNVVELENLRTFINVSAGTSSIKYLQRYRFDERIIMEGEGAVDEDLVRSVDVGGVVPSNIRVWNKLVPTLSLSGVVDMKGWSIWSGHVILQDPNKRIHFRR